MPCAEDFLNQALILHLCVIFSILYYKRQSSFFRWMHYQFIVAVLFWWLFYLVPAFQKGASLEVLKSPLIPIIYTAVLLLALMGGFILIWKPLQRIKKITTVILITFFILVTVFEPFQWSLENASNNLWVGHLYIVIEMILILYGLTQILTSVISKTLIKYGFLLTSVLFLTHRLSGNIEKMAQMAIGVNNILISTLIILYFFERASNSKEVLRKSEFSILTGLLIYFVCLTPFISVFNILHIDLPQAGTDFYDTVISLIMNNLRYTMALISLIILFRSNHAGAIG